MLEWATRGGRFCDESMSTVVTWLAHSTRLQQWSHFPPFVGPIHGVTRWDQCPTAARGKCVNRIAEDGVEKPLALPRRRDPQVRSTTAPRYQHCWSRALRQEFHVCRTPGYTRLLPVRGSQARRGCAQCLVAVCPTHRWEWHGRRFRRHSGYLVAVRLHRRIRRPVRLRWPHAGAWRCDGDGCLDGRRCRRAFVLTAAAGAGTRHGAVAACAFAVRLGTARVAGVAARGGRRGAGTRASGGVSRGGGPVGVRETRWVPCCSSPLPGGRVDCV